MFTKTESSYYNCFDPSYPFDLVCKKIPVEGVKGRGDDKYFFNHRNIEGKEVQAAKVHWVNSDKIVGDGYYYTFEPLENVSDFKQRLVEKFKSDIEYQEKSYRNWMAYYNKKIEAAGSEEVLIYEDLTKH